MQSDRRTAMKLYYTDRFELPLPEDHQFPMSKYRRLRERIVLADWAKCCELVVPDAATDQQLCLVHDSSYVQQMISGRISEKEMRRVGFPWSPELVERSRRSTGATIASAVSALSSGGISANLAGGTHHAFRDRGEGYCVFNDVAVAARVLQSDYRVGTILIVDCDVHQGNGTAEIFANDDSVLTFSIHGKRNYPLRKTQSDLDLALDTGATDDEYLEQLEPALATLLQRRPEFVFYVAGADPFEKDRLGRLGLTKRGLRVRDEMVMKRCRELKLPISMVMAGGYADDVDDIVDIHTNTIRTAVEFLSL